jgi:nitroreductase
MENKNILEGLKWRYATKVFDSSKKLSEDQVEQLKEIISLTPSSYGLEPYKVIIITNEELRLQLKKVSWNQAQVTDSSHYVVFLHKKTISEDDIKEFVNRTANIRSVDISTLEVYQNLMIGDLVNGPRSKIISQWSKNQVYNALGNTMTGLSALEIDSCPLEGFDPFEYNKILELEETEFTTSVCLAVGFRDESDKYATLKKVRKSHDELIKEI